VVTLYACQEVFHVGGKRVTVKLHHEGGDVVQTQEASIELL
jgi:hypothetical protein